MKELTKEFHKACKLGNINLIDNILSISPDLINISTEEGWSPLILACYNEHFELVSMLLDRGANVNASNKNGTTVLMYAKTPIQNKHKNMSILSLLLERGADINSIDIYNKTILDYVLENGDDFLKNWIRDRGGLYGFELRDND